MNRFLAPLAALALVPALAWAGPDGLRGFIASTGETVCLLETGLESTHWDIDTPEAYRQLVNPAPD